MKNWTSRAASLAVAVSCLAILAASGPAEAAKSRKSASPGIALTLPETKSDEPVLMLVSLEKQSIRVFSGETLVAQSKVSTGKKGHATPTGVFSILEKKRRHHSNIYSRAPMPFMQRLTWSGIALHESKSVPDYPASHGCVRLPRAFAKQLYRYTDLGAHVIITEEEISLRQLSDGTPFGPRDDRPDRVAGGRDSASVHHVSSRPAAPHYAQYGGPSVDARMSLPAGPVKTGIGETFTLRASLDDGAVPADHGIADAEVADEPVRILITRRTGRELVRDIQTMLNGLGFDAGETDGWMGPATGRAIIAFQKEHELTPTGTLSVELAALLREKSGRPASANGHIYVRRSGKPVFDAPIKLKTPEEPLGTHFLSALPSPTNPDKVVWVSATLADTVAVSPLSEIAQSGATGRGISPIGVALDRIGLPEALRTRLEALSIAGSSLVISDHGVSRETLRGTDFVVLTRPPD